MVLLGEKKPWVDGSWEMRDMGISAQEQEIADGEVVKNVALGS